MKLTTADLNLAFNVIRKNTTAMMLEMFTRTSELLPIVSDMAVEKLTPIKPITIIDSNPIALSSKVEKIS